MHSVYFIISLLPIYNIRFNLKYSFSLLSTFCSLTSEMRPLAFALIVLSIQGIVAWDMRDWSDRWWKQDTTPIKHKHHKHYRHHHHRTQLCQPVGLTTTTTATTIPQATFQPISSISGGQEEKPPPLLSGGGGLEEDLPPSINGNLTSTGTDCGTSLTTLAVSKGQA